MQDLDEMPARLAFIANALKLSFRFMESCPQRLYFVRVP
jgi:hypothetical protein